MRGQTVTPSTEWMRHGLCAGAPDPDLWFPEVGRRDTAQEAKAICAVCPVAAECRAYADVLGVEHGIWGGEGRAERRRERQVVRRRRQSMSPATRQRKTEAERERRRRLRETAAAGDREAAEGLDGERTRKRAVTARPATGQRARKARAS